jgi:hypothetical protein
MQTPGGNLANADTKTSTQTLPAPGAPRNPVPAEFTRVQSKFAQRHRTLHRVRGLASVRTTYTVMHRDDARHFPSWPDVLAHLAKIGGAA